jgi:resuscitation-promoting factor RpfB
MRIGNFFSRSPVYLLLSLSLLLSVSTLFIISGVGAATDDDAKDGRLVTIHDRGKEKVILTHAQTIGDALQAARVTIAPEDKVEPSVDERLVATDYTVNIYRARPVIVVDGMVRQKIMTAAQTAGSISEAAGLKLNDEDKTKLGASADVISDGASVILEIDRATPFQLNLYGKTSTAYSQEATVGAMLKKKSITLGPDDSLSVPENTPLTDGLAIAIWRNGKQTVTIEESIAFSTRKIQDADQTAGYRKIQTPGVNGRKNVTYEIIMQNGKEVSRKAIQSVELEAPKEQVEVVGAKSSFSGDFAAALAKLRACESGGNYANKKNPTYRGAYQFGYQTWANNGGYYDPADAPPALQDAAARALYERRGWQPWPACSKKLNLPDSYR